MKRTNTQKGITLVALIITIIVLLILAVVAISSVQETGILRFAKKANSEYEKAKIEEEVQLILTSINMDVKMNSSKYTLNPEDGDYSALINTPVIFEEKKLEIQSKYLFSEDGITILNPETLDVRYTPDNSMIDYIVIPITYKGNAFEVRAIIGTTIVEDELVNMYVKYFELGSSTGIGFATETTTPKVEADGVKVASVVDGVPIPKGFTHMEGTTKNTGLVIVDNDNGNQFVWVPVDTDPKLNITVKGEASNKIKKVVITDIDGDVISEDVNDDYYKKTIKLTKNTMYQVDVTYEDGTTETKYYVANTVYDNTIRLKYHNMLMGLGQWMGLSEDATYDTMIASHNENKEDSEKISTRLELLSLVYGTEEFDMIKIQDNTPEKSSVFKYGGFYIGRYEVGEGKVIKNGEKPLVPVSYEEALNIAQTAYNNSTSVTSTLPSGAAWDTIGSWIINTGARSYYEMYTDPDGWAYEPDREVRNTGGSKAVANNICDIVGNAAEWITRTIEGKNVAMGSKCIGGPNAAFDTVADDDNSSTGDAGILGLRVLLYVK